MNIYLYSRSALTLTFQVRKRLAVILRREHLPDDFLSSSSYPIIQTSLPLSESDQSNLVGNFLS